MNGKITCKILELFFDFTLRKNSKLNLEYGKNIDVTNVQHI